MKTILRRYICLFAAAMGLALPAVAARATNDTIDYTDLWYNAPAESQSGWGVNVIQQGSTMFVTMFIFGSDNTPRWYVASNVVATGSSTYSGQLFNVGTGTWFGAPWTGISNVAQVGTIAFTFNSATTGTMVYSINNVQVTKSIVRQTFVADNLTGNYIGGVVGSGSACGQNGILIHGNVTIAHTQPNITISVDFINGNNVQSNCRYTGQYAPTGSLGAIAGTYNCTFSGTANPLSGNFNISELRSTRNGLNGRISGSDQFCTYNGFFGGIRDVL